MTTIGRYKNLQFVISKKRPLRSMDATFQAASVIVSMTASRIDKSVIELYSQQSKICYFNLLYSQYMYRFFVCIEVYLVGPALFVQF